jgi:hypothetical protein
VLTCSCGVGAETDGLVPAEESKAAGSHGTFPYAFSSLVVSMCYLLAQEKTIVLNGRDGVSPNIRQLAARRISAVGHRLHQC